jgi:hypothetical protein
VKEEEEKVHRKQDPERSGSLFFTFMYRKVGGGIRFT